MHWLLWLWASELPLLRRELYEQSTMLALRWRRAEDVYELRRIWREKTLLQLGLYAPSGANHSRGDRKSKSRDVHLLVHCEHGDFSYARASRVLHLVDDRDHDWSRQSHPVAVVARSQKRQAQAGLTKSPEVLTDVFFETPTSGDPLDQNK